MFVGNTARKLDNYEGFSGHTDTELVAQLAEDFRSSNNAMNELAKRHYTWIYRICLMRLGSTADAQDVTQDVLMRVHKYAHKFENRSAVRTWLYRIAQNQCNTFVAKFNRVDFESIDDFVEVLPDAQAERIHVANELTEQVYFIMSKLSSQCKTIIDLRFFQDLSLEEISNRLKIGLSTAKMRLYRALEQFKSIYSEEIKLSN